MDLSHSNSGKRITDYSNYFNTVARKRIPLPRQKQDEYKKIIPKASQVCMDHGAPSDIQFPVIQATFTSRDGSEITINPEEMKTALQYVSHKGLPELREWVMGLYKRVHNPPTMDDKHLPSSLALQICAGGKEGVSKTIGSLLEKGDSFIAEDATYQTLMTVFLPHDIKGVPVKADCEGMDCDLLYQVLSDWNEEKQGRRPQLLYVVPTCSNPTGKTWSERRKKEVYDVSRKFDLLIVEDDPYYYLQFEKPLSPSFLSMDTDGRVIHIDSFSKTISPGCRVGILFGPAQIIEKIQLAVFPDNGGSSGFAQMMIYKVVDSWGYDRFLQHTDKLANYYKRKADTAIQLANKYLTGLCEWRNPDGGFFLWMKLLGTDNCDMVLEEVMKRGVFIMSGSVFTLDRSPVPYVRLSYSLASDEQMEKGLSVLADVLKTTAQQKGHI